MHIVYIGRNIHIYFIYNVIYYNLLLNMITMGKFFIKIDFQENEVMPLVILKTCPCSDEHILGLTSLNCLLWVAQLIYVTGNH